MAIIIVIFAFSTSCASVLAFCFEDAGRYYGISPDLLKAIARVESNMQPRTVSRNKNGSIDYCHMQINSYWKRHLRSRWQSLGDPCYCTEIGAWILRQCIDRYGYNWDAISCYHTGKSISELGPAQRRRAIRYIEKVGRFLRPEFSR